MAFSHLSIDFDIEEIYRKRDNHFENINAETLPKIKQMINTLYASVNHSKNIVKVSKLRNHFAKVLNRVNRQSGIKGWIVKKPYLVYVYQKMIKDCEIQDDPLFWSLLRKCPTRSASGINSFAILLSDKPWKMEGSEKIVQNFSCKHDCKFCPDQPGMPRSYLELEPAVARGARHNWDPEAQLKDRLNSLLMQGHEPDKLELILEGGTYTEYPVEYLEDFHRRLFYTANTYYNNVPKREMFSISEEMKINKDAKVRIIGICIETRPDAIFDSSIDGDQYFWIKFFRRTGTTRVQLGAQHINNQILKKCNRGHTYEVAEEAAQFLQNNCFKVDGHFMPDLPYSSVEEDCKMFDRVVECGVWDAIKIYPYAVVPWTYFKKKIDEGKITLYSQTNPRGVFDVIKYALSKIPRWMRVARAQRDIPKSYISNGNNVSNTRQLVENEMHDEGIEIHELRSREISRNPDYSFNDAEYFTDFYPAGDGVNIFIECASPDRKACFGFIRLRITSNKNEPVFKCLKNRGLIRELHVYSNLIGVGKGTNLHSTQHRGVGKKLLKIAENVAWVNNCIGTAVITGEGVRGYYHKNGYHDDETFVVKNFKNFKSNIDTMLKTIINIGIIVFFGFMLITYLHSHKSSLDY